MILSDKLKKRKKLLQEKIAESFKVSRLTASIAFSQLKKDRLVVTKKGVGSFVVSPLGKGMKRIRSRK
jgi:DNA-binding GntR family transcriptional regulator